MKRDGVSDLLFALLAEPIDDPPRVLVGPLLVVGVVQQAGDGPGLRVGPPYFPAAARMTISTARACFRSDSLWVQACS